MEKIIQTNSLSKSYGSQKVIDDLNFYIKKGQTYALLGPNGSGKSTIINLLSTCVPIEQGQVLIDQLRLGPDNKEIRKRIGVVFQSGVLDHVLSVEENLSIRGSFYGLRGRYLQNRICKIAQMTGISTLLNKPYGILSGGQQRRCDIARAILPLPKILFLDEPTTGLDPEIRAGIWNSIQNIKKENDITILLTTHYMEEAAHADSIAILNHGRITASGKPSVLKEQFSSNQLILLTNQIESLQFILNQKKIPYQKETNKFKISLTKTLDALPILHLCRGAFSGFEVLRGTMDDAYLSIIEGRS